MENQHTDQLNAALEQLKNYIKQQIQTGVQPNEIHTQLKQAGWQDDAIQHAFRLLQADIIPSHMPAGTPGPVAAEATAYQAQPGSQTMQQPMPNTVTRGRFKTGWLLFKQSIRILKNNKKLTRYVVMSFVLSLILTLIFMVIFLVGRNVLLQNTVTGASNNVTPTPAGVAVAFLYYVLAYFIVNLYSAGMVANVIDLFHGRSQTYSSYMKIAWSKGGTLFIFSIIEATIGLILRAIAERSRLLGRIIAWLLGAMWSLARLFVVPVIVTSDDNAAIAIKRSTKLLITTWGENLAGRVSFAGIATVLLLLVLLPVGFGVVLLGRLLGGAIGAIIGVIFLALLLLAFNMVLYATSSILNTALFYYAQYRQIPAAFDAELINSVFIRRKRRGFLGFGRKRS